MIIDHIRDVNEFIELYKSVDNSNLPSIDEILNLKDCVFCFYNKDTGKLEGVVYIESIDGKIFLSGFSIKKHYAKNILAVKAVCEYFKADEIYSQTPFKHAALVLKKAGFKHYKDKIYKYIKR